MECPYCRIALATEATHCAKCGLRVVSLDRTEQAPPVGRATRAHLAEAARLGGVGAVGILTACAPLALVFRDAQGYFRSYENAMGIIGGLTLVVAFFMGRVRLGAYRRHLELADRMERERPSAEPGTRIAVAIAGAIPLLIAFVLSLAEG